CWSTSGSTIHLVTSWPPGSSPSRAGRAWPGGCSSAPTRSSRAGRPARRRSASWPTRRADPSGSGPARRGSCEGSMSDGPPDGHDWAARRLLAYSAAMLPEDELLALEEHLRSCPDCRARLAQLKPIAGADAGHLPASLIATWPRSSALLEGLERELVESHLKSCESCRAALAFAGHAPHLAREPVAVRGGVGTAPRVR